MSADTSYGDIARAAMTRSDPGTSQPHWVTGGLIRRTIVEVLTGVYGESPSPSQVDDILNRVREDIERRAQGVAERMGEAKRAS